MKKYLIKCLSFLAAVGSLWLIPQAQATSPAMTSPTPGSALTSSSATFQWSSGTGVTAYYLYVGTSVGANDLFGQNTGLNLSTNVSNLPVNGSTLYVRLWWFITTWQFTDYTYTAAATVPAMISPTPGSTLTSVSATFQWSSGAGVTSYYLYVGSSVGANDLFGQSIGLNLSANVSNLPVNGSPLYVRLWWLNAAGWQFTDYTYTAATVVTPPAMVSPPPGSALTYTSATFQWSSGTGVTNYYLYVGSSVGANDLFGQNAGPNLSANVSNLPANGSTLYVRLWWFSAAVWQFTDYTYRAYSGTVTLPMLVTVKQNSNIVLRWPTNFTGYTLMSSTNLGTAAVWSAVSPPPVVVNWQYLVTNSITGQRKFYRLKHP
jgi:hypothetical protein